MRRTWQSHAESLGEQIHGRRQRREYGRNTTMIATAALQAIKCVTDFLRTQRLPAALNLWSQSSQNGEHLWMLAAAALQTVKCVTDLLRAQRFPAALNLGSQSLQNGEHL